MPYGIDRFSGDQTDANIFDLAWIAFWWLRYFMHGLFPCLSEYFKRGEWRVLGASWVSMAWRDRQRPLGNANRASFMRFFKTVIFGETLEFDLVVTRVGRASLTLRHMISVANQTRWTCTQVLASSDLDSHTAKPRNDTVKSLLETWQIDTDELPFWNLIKQI